MVKMDPIGEPLSLAQRKLWEALGLLRAAQYEATRAGHRKTEAMIGIGLDCVERAIDDGTAKALEAHDKETRV